MVHRSYPPGPGRAEPGARYTRGLETSEETVCCGARCYTYTCVRVHRQDGEDEGGYEGGREAEEEGGGNAA